MEQAKLKKVYKYPEYQKTWQEANKDRISKKSRLWYLANKEKAKDNRKRSYEANKQKNVAQSKKWALENPERHLEISKSGRLRRTYGLSLIAYNDMISNQNNSCAICNQLETAKDSRRGKIKDLAVDHNHKTGKVRGLLCQKHNQGLGLFDDSIELLENAIKYLKEYNEKS